MFIDELSGVTGQAVRLALDAAVLRHQVAANNVANVSTPGYETVRVRFEELLQAATIDLEDDAAVADSLERARESLGRDASLERTGRPVQLDAEMVELADNTLRYQALLRGLSSRSSIVSLAIKQGRE